MLTDFLTKIIDSARSGVSRRGPGLSHTLLILGLAAALSACSLSNTLREPTRTPAPLQMVQVTAQQAAQAMQNDEFYSDFRGEVLSVQGKVRSVQSANGASRIELETGINTTLYCDLASQPASIRAGDQVTVQAAAADAERAPSAVILKKCQMLH